MHRFPALFIVAAALLPLGCAAALAADDAKTKPDEAKQEEKAKEKEKEKTVPIFDGKTLKGWEITDFGGGGDVRVKEGQLILGFGQPLTGVNRKEKKGLPTTNYEVSFEAQRVDGADFFVGFTFPVGKEFCSFIVGGWGGGLVGLSSLNGEDASENETTTYERFENGKWYKFRLRVTDKKVEAWINDEQVVEVNREGYEFSLRIEVELSRPFGFATFQSTAAIRKLKLQLLDEKQLSEEEKKKAGGP